MKLVYFVRHGESTGNVGKDFQGPNAPLTEEGLAQATTIAERVATLPVGAMIVSTMARTLETADRIRKRTGWEPEVSALFVERLKPTTLNGRLRTDPEACQLNKEWEDSLFTSGAKVLDGENFEELRKRAANAISFLEKRPEEHLLVVTHGFFLRMILAYMMFEEELGGSVFQRVMQTFQTSNTGLTIAAYNEKPAAYQRPWRILTWNDRAHLADPTS